MIARTTFASLACLALAIAGCGSTVNDDDKTDPGAGGSTGSGASGNGGSGNGGAGNGTSTGTGGACAGYEDAEGNGEVTLRIVNNAPMDLYIPRNCNEGEFSVLGEDGNDWHQDLSCELSCQELQTSSQILCGACQSSVIQVPSFGSAEIVWKGTGLAAVDMPDACYFDQSFPETCHQVVGAPPQVYRIEVPGFPQCQSFDEGGCKCVDGICDAADVAGFQGFHEPAQLQYPAAKTIDVVFESCAFGCPNGEDEQPQPGDRESP